jgi:hypothetical protein
MSKYDRWVFYSEKGAYTSTSLLGLVYEILKHRTQHLLKGQGWRD